MSTMSDDKFGLTLDKNQYKNKNKRRKYAKETETDIYKVVKMILERHYEPVIVFNFARKDAEANAMAMTKLDFCNLDEKKMIHQIFNNALDSLSTHDRELSQIQEILPILKRG